MVPTVLDLLGIDPPKADIEIPDGGAEGILLARGGAAGGFCFYMKDGHVKYGLNYVSRDFFEVASPDPDPAGSHTVRFEFEATGQPDFAAGKGAPGKFQLYVDGDLVAETEVPHTTPMFYEIEGLSCGYDLGAPVLHGVYQPPFAFTGTINSVTMDLSGELIKDDEAEVARLMAQQ